MRLSYPEFTYSSTVLSLYDNTDDVNHWLLMKGYKYPILLLKTVKDNQ